MGMKSFFNRITGRRSRVSQTDGVLNWIRSGVNGIYVNRETAMGIAAVFGCIRVLSETLATQPIITYKRLPNGGKERAPEHPVYKLLRYKPNQYQTAAVFKESMMISGALEGNAFAHIMRNGRGEPAELIFMRPDRTVITLNASRQKAYTYTTNEGQQIPLSSDEVLHIPSLPGSVSAAQCFACSAG